MLTKPLADVKNSLSSLVQDAQEGHSIGISVRGTLAAILIPPPDRQQIQGRLHETLLEMAAKPSRLAEAMGSDDLTVVDDLLRGEATPKASFLKAFAERFGIAYDYLAHGDGPPFTTVSWGWERDDATYILSLQRGGKPLSRLVFIRQDPREETSLGEQYAGQSTAVLFWDDLTAQVISHAVHLSPLNGSGGYQRLAVFARFCRQMDQRRPPGLIVSSVTIPGAQLREILQGRAWAGNVLRTGINTTWADDFWDIHHQWVAVAPNYEFHHGKAFVQAQHDLRHYMTPEAAKP